MHQFVLRIYITTYRFIVCGKAPDHDINGGVRLVGAGCAGAHEFRSPRGSRLATTCIPIHGQHKLQSLSLVNVQS